jgi:hypothetical protein
MRKLLLGVALAAFVTACQPPAPRPEAPPETPPTVAACNAVAPDAARQVTIEDELAVAAAASDLRGGRIAPGVYDLTRAVRIGGATGWSGTRAVTLDVTENPTGGVTFNWAGRDADGATDTWTANFAEAPTPRLSYTCGRIGDVDAEFTAANTTLQLRLPDGANGRLQLDFQRRP